MAELQSNYSLQQLFAKKNLIKFFYRNNLIVIEVKKVIEIINKILSQNNKNTIQLNPQTILIGGIPEFDSMNIVQLCLALEEESNNHGFEFDWTSEKAMSNINSIFKNPQTLTDEFNRQNLLDK